MTLDSLMAEGQQALQAGDVAVALHAYERAAALAPDDLGLAWIRGVLLVRLERYQEALPHLVRAQGHTEQAPSVWTHLGIAHTYLGNPEEALAAFQRAVEAAPGDPNVRVRLATALNDTGAQAAALGVLDQAVPLAKDPVVAGFLFLQRGIALNALGRPGEALEALELVGQLGGDVHAIAALGLQQAAALNALDRPAEALTALDGVGAVARPGPVAAQRAAALNALGRHDEALAVLPDARADAATARAAAVEQGVALVGVGRTGDALAVLEPVLAELDGPARARALEAQGTAQLALGRPAEAARTLTDAATSTPPGPRRRSVMVVLARSLADIGRPDDAARALAEAATEGSLDAAFERERSALLLAIGRTADAADALEHAVQLEPTLADDPAISHQRLAVGLATGGPEQAADALEHAAGVDARHAPLLQVARAEALFAAGRAAEAVAQLEDVVGGSGDGADPTPLVGRALAALALGRVDDAVEAFDGAVGAGAEASDRTNALAGALVALAGHHPGDARAAAVAVAAAGAGRDGLAELVAGMAAAEDGDPAAAAEALDRVAALQVAPAPVVRLAAEQRAWLAVAWDDPNAAARFASLPASAAQGPAGAVGAAGLLLLAPAGAEEDQRSADVAGAAAVLPAGHPARTLAAVARGVVLGREGRHDEALFAYEHGLEQGEGPAGAAGDAAALLGMGATYLHLEDPEPALQAFQRAHDHAHDQRAAVLALIGQGDALARLGDGEKAIEANRAAVRLEPGTARTWLGLAAAYQRLRRFAAADSALARATALGGGAAVDTLRSARPANATAEVTSPPVDGTGGSWVGFWFSSGGGRRVVGMLLVALAIALGVLALIEPSRVDGLDWLRDDGVGGPAAALLGVVVLLVAPSFGSRSPAPVSTMGASVEPAEPPPSVPLPAAADLVATARAAGAAATALVLAAEVVRAGPTTG